MAAVFAGRAAEFSALKAAAREAREGRFSAVLISGEPGIGKSRLAEETCNYARGLGFELAVGHCAGSRSRLSYFPFIQAFRHLARHQLPPIRAEALPSATQPPSGAVAMVERLAGRAPGSVGSCAENALASQAELFESVIGVLRARAETCPLLILLEDLDRADEGSLSLLVHLLPMSVPARLLIIGTCRGNDGPERSELVNTIAECSRHRCFQRIRLRGLAAIEAVNLVEQLLQPHDLAGKSKRLAADIGRLANGNPRFIHQIVCHLVESGRLARRTGRGGAAFSGWDSRLAAEEGLREVVDEHLSRLSGNCRLALSHAAVLGDEFELGVLVHMLSFTDREVADLLEEARAAGIVTETSTEETGDYAFAHGLIRQSLYERQSRPAKRALHASAARAIEAADPASLGPHLAQLALHYTKAGAAGDVAKGAEYSLRAGEVAFATCAYADAASHWRAALRLASESAPRLRARLLERLGEASLLSAATPAEAARHLQTALQLYTELRQEADAARVHARLVTVISLLTMSPAATDVGLAVSHSRQAGKLLAVSTDHNAEGELLIGEALAAHAQFRTSEGLAASERAMEIGQLIDNAAIWCQAAALHGHLLWASGKLTAGLTLMEQALERADRTRDPKQQFAAAWALGFSYLLLWDPIAASRALQTALAESETGQVEFLHQMLVAHLGIAHVYTGALARARSLLTIAPHRFLEANLRFLEGEWSLAEDLLSQQIEQSHLAQSKQQHWTASLWLARLKRIQGEPARGLELLTHTPLMAESLVRIPEEIVTRSELALVRLARGEVAVARTEVERCRTLLDPGEDWRALPALVDRAEAALLAHGGRLEEASHLWLGAGQLFSRYQLPWEVAETLVSRGTLLMQHSRSDEGAASLTAAAQIYQQLDLGASWHHRIKELGGNSTPAHCAPSLAPTIRETRAESELMLSGGIHSLVTTHDVALLATLIHDAIAHLMNAIDKAAKVRGPIERIAAATEKISRISTPIERLAHALEQADRNTLAGRPDGSPRSRPGRRQKLNRSHDPGRPL